MLRAIADTHTIIWYLFDDSRLSTTAGAEIDEAARDGDQIGFSSISLIEIVYLAERSRIDQATFVRLLAAVDLSDAVLVEVPVDRQVAVEAQQIDRTQIPDMPDRIITATARRYGVPVITRDTDIRQSNVATVW